MNGQGVVFVAYGSKAKAELKKALNNLPDVPHYAQLDDLPGMVKLNNVQRSRYAKTHLDEWTPFERTLYLDADTRCQVKDLEPLFAPLDEGWHFVICPSGQQGENWLWHVAQAERDAVRAEYQFEPLQLQAGVFAWRCCPEVKEFFRNWRGQWAIHQDQDQAALLLALARSPLKVWLMGHPWNGGAAIAHRFGAARDENTPQIWTK